MGVWSDKKMFLIHIREFYRGGPEGKFHVPTTKGIALTYDVWKRLYLNMERINRDVESFHR